jgi:hypothetical protein
MTAPHRNVLAELDAHDPVHSGEMPLDPGIRRYVLILRSEGIETFQSCQGAGGHDAEGMFRTDGNDHNSPEPSVRFAGNAYEGFKAFAIAMTYGLPVRSVRRCYDFYGGELHGPDWEMTFRHADRAASTALREGLTDVAETAVPRA